MIFLSEGTIPSSFAGLPEFPDQFVAGLLQESLNALRTRNDGNHPCRSSPQGDPFFSGRQIFSIFLSIFVCWFITSSGLQQSSYQIRSWMQGLPYGVSFLAPCIQDPTWQKTMLRKPDRWGEELRKHTKIERKKERCNHRPTKKKYAPLQKKVLNLGITFEGFALRLWRVVHKSDKQY